MTEISEGQLQALFGAHQQPRMSPEQQAHIEAVSKALHDAQMLAYAQVQFFAPILCDCDRYYEPGAPRPPQMGCVVHGHVQVDQDGAVLMFGIPDKW